MGGVAAQNERQRPTRPDLDAIFGPDPVVGESRSEPGENRDREADDRESWYHENRPPHHDPR
jgi:hypothetical protein